LFATLHHTRRGSRVNSALTSTVDVRPLPQLTLQSNVRGLNPPFEAVSLSKSDPIGCVEPASTLD
jgi:hypothetical protein